MKQVVVIGAGIGGLVAAAVLARAGWQVTVLEAHIYAGGCAGTFYHQGYRLDAGATLAAGFYPGGPMDRVAQQTGVPGWGPAKAVEPAMLVHLPGNHVLPVWGDERRHPDRLQAFGQDSRSFWDWQEEAAQALWNLALQLPDWPPQSFSQAWRLAGQGLHWLAEHPTARAGFLPDAFRSIATHLPRQNETLRRFIDAQLLISAQATGRQANALYAAAALDLARRGVVHLEGGMGRIAQVLVEAIRQHGGQVLFRQEATRIRLGRPNLVETRRAASFSADLIIANLSPWNIARLCDPQMPRSLKHLPAFPSDAWGAFILYLGIDASVLPPGFACHHQVIVGEPLGEGRSAFISISPDWDTGRAPAGARAVTISTHSALVAWQDLDQAAYSARKQEYTGRLLAAAEKIMPGLRQAVRLALPGTPLTFQRFTQRHLGWVGGFPQTNLFRTWGPRLAPGLWMVGDSIFPGQSTAAVALGGLRVARAILAVK